MYRSYLKMSVKCILIFLLNQIQGQISIAKMTKYSFNICREDKLYQQLVNKILPQMAESKIYFCLAIYIYSIIYFYFLKSLYFCKE